MSVFTEPVHIAGGFAENPERLRYGQHLKVCEEADTFHATFSPSPLSNQTASIPSDYLKERGAVWLRCSASPPPHCYLLLTFLFPLPFSLRRLFLLFLWSANALRNPPALPGVLYTISNLPTNCREVLKGKKTHAWVWENSQKQAISAS